MTEIYSHTEERPGNDAWITDSITIFRDEDGLSLRHKHTAKGSWFDPVRQVNEQLLSDDFNKAQEQVDLYLKENSLEDKFSIILLNLI